MGHERGARVPKTQRWQSIVKQIVQCADTGFDVTQVTRETIKNVRGRFRNLQNDEGTRAAFTFLIRFAILSKYPEKLYDFVELDGNVKSLTPLVLAKELREYVTAAGGSPEYSAIAEGAAIDAIVGWYTANKSHQESLFQSFDMSNNVWGKASKGSGFCDLSRLYFGTCQ